jgi:DNA recombination protein Rad52
MGFTDCQVKALEAKLSAKKVRTREKEGKVLSYVEGWHVISEANRVFGFDAWDRETLETRCVWEGTLNGLYACSYVARVRVRVRAGGIFVLREGSGAGHSSNPGRGGAHENAIKGAETDAMKRALATFGNPFGLALYDKEQHGVRQRTSRPAGKPVSWVLLGSTGEPLGKHQDPVTFCSAARQSLERLDDAESLKSFWKHNQGTVAELRKQLPLLQTEKGVHYSDILRALYKSRLEEFVAQEKTALDKGSGDACDAAKAVPKRPHRGSVSNRTPQPGESRPTKIKIDPIQRGPRRVRDKEHLKYVASRNCVICGRTPSQAHHLRFTQPRALGRKVSDEWTVPLCAIHHRVLHEFGNEEEWWQKQGLNPTKEAERLWLSRHKLQEAG